MKHAILLALALGACTGKRDAADSADAAIPAVDTLKPIVASDTALIAHDSAVTQPTPAPTGSTKATKTQTPAPTDTRARDSAFPPPRNLPKLDTVGAKKKPPV